VTGTNVGCGIKGVGTGADEELGPTGDDVVGAGVGTVVVVDTDEGADMDDGAGTDAGASTGAVGTAAVGTGVDADTGYNNNKNNNNKYLKRIFLSRYVVFREVL